MSKCKKCKVPLQSSSARYCLRCEAAETVQCPECLTLSGHLKPDYRRNRATSEQKRCKVCDNDRFLLREELPKGVSP